MEFIASSVDRHRRPHRRRLWLPVTTGDCRARKCKTPRLIHELFVHDFAESSRSDFGLHYKVRKRYQGQVHSFMFNVKLLPKAYDAIDDVAAH